MPLRDAVILCAGKGTRVSALNASLPKVMLSVAGKPLLEHHLSWLRRHGVERVFINLHHLPDAIRGYFGGGERFGVQIHYSYEPELRGTAGALNGFRSWLTVPFLLHYGDVYSELSLDRLFAFHQEHGSDATLVVHETSHPEDSDIVEMDASCRVCALHHKPGRADFGNLGNAACYLLGPAVLDYVPQKEGQYDFIRHVFPLMVAERRPVFGYPTKEFLMDMGTVDRYQRLQDRLEAAE